MASRRMIENILTDRHLIYTVQKQTSCLSTKWQGMSIKPTVYRQNDFLPKVMLYKTFFLLSGRIRTLDLVFTSQVFYPWASRTQPTIRKVCKKGKVVLIRLGTYVFVNKARGGGSPKFFINTLWQHNYMRVKFVYLWRHNYIIRNTNYKQPR